jgi:hypothetical protein
MRSLEAGALQTAQHRRTPLEGTQQTVDLTRKDVGNCKPARVAFTGGPTREDGSAWFHEGSSA